MATEILDIQFALFNCHINNAREKVQKIFIKRFGQEKWDKELKPIESQGIMSIFNSEPNYYTQWYVEMIWYFVNEVELA